MSHAMLQPRAAIRILRTVAPAPRATLIVPVKVSVISRPNITSDCRSIGSSGQRSVCVPIPTSPRCPYRCSRTRPQGKRQPKAGGTPPCGRLANVTRPPLPPAPPTAKQPPTERWPSGRRRTPGKCVGGEPSRGFESLSLRQFQIPNTMMGPFGAVFCRNFKGV